jgi:hypothetical protein
MRKNEDIQKDIQNAIIRNPLLNAANTGVFAKIGKHMKKSVYLVCLAGLGLFFNSCATGGYITYQESARPARPSNVHIWINGDWIFNNQTNTYVQNTGYWDKPEKDRTFVPGRWESTPRGHHWQPGHWVTLL